MPPRAELTTSILDDPLTELDDEAIVLCNGNKFIGEYHSALGMMPPDKRLEAMQHRSLKVDDRLVLELKLTFFQRLFHFHFDAKLA